MPTLFDAKGDVIDFGSPTLDLTTEFATRMAAGTDVGAMLGFLPDPDPVLLKRGDSADVLEDLTADDQVCMAMQARKLRVLNSQDYDFSSGQAKGKDASSDAIRLRDALAADMESINLRNVFSSILDAPFYGFTPLELIWRPEGGRYRLVDIMAKPRRWFGYDDKNKPVFQGEMSIEGKQLPSGKFVFVRHFPTYENPYGLRLLSRCLWPVAFKRGGIEFLTRFVEKFGMPWVLAKAPKSAERAQRMTMAQDLAAMVQDAVAVLPSGAEVEVTSAAGKAGDLHEKYLSRWDKSISKVLMGQTLTAEMDGNGSLAASKTHYAVGDDMASSDQFLVAATMNDIAIAYRDVNSPREVMAPVFGYNEPEDSVAQADLDAKLHGVGVRFNKAHFTRRYGLGEDEFKLEGEATEAGDETDVDHSAFAEGEDTQAVIDKAVRDVMPAAIEANEKLVSQIEKIVQDAESFDDVQVMLAELLGQEAQGNDIEDLLARIMVNADLYGRWKVGEQE